MLDQQRTTQRFCREAAAAEPLDLVGSKRVFGRSRLTQPGKYVIDALGVSGSQRRRYRLTRSPSNSTTITVAMGSASINPLVISFPSLTWKAAPSARRYARLIVFCMAGNVNGDAGLPKMHPHDLCKPMSGCRFRYGSMRYEFPVTTFGSIHPDEPYRVRGLSGVQERWLSLTSMRPVVITKSPCGSTCCALTSLLTKRPRSAASIHDLFVSTRLGFSPVLQASP